MDSYCLHCNKNNPSTICGKLASKYHQNKYDNLGQQDFSRRMCMPPIDVVYTWVNGSDNDWRKTMEYWREIYLKLKTVDENVYGNEINNNSNGSGNQYFSMEHGIDNYANNSDSAGRHDVSIFHNKDVTERL